MTNGSDDVTDVDSLDTDLAERIRENHARGLAWFVLPILLFVNVGLGLQNWLTDAGLPWWAAFIVTMVPLLIPFTVWLKRSTRPAPAASGAERYLPHTLLTPRPFAVVVVVHLVASASWSGLGRRLDVEWPPGVAGTLVLGAGALVITTWWYRTRVTDEGRGAQH